MIIRHAAHRASGERFGDACQNEDELSSAYRDTYEEATAPCLLGDVISLRSDRDDCVAVIAQRFDAQRKQLEKLARVAPEIAAQAVAALDAKEVENVALLVPLNKRRRVAKRLAGRPQGVNGGKPATLTTPPSLPFAPMSAALPRKAGLKPNTYRNTSNQWPTWSVRH